MIRLDRDLEPGSFTVPEIALRVRARLNMHVAYNVREAPTECKSGQIVAHSSQFDHARATMLSGGLGTYNMLTLIHSCVSRHALDGAQH